MTRNSAATHVWPTVLIGVFLSACDWRAPQPAQVKVVSGPIAVLARSDSARENNTLESRTRALIKEDSALSDSARKALVEQLESTARSGIPDSMASALLRLGWLGLRDPEYDGADFQRLLEDHSESQWMDDAAWGLTFIKHDNDCKSSAVCETERATRPFVDFLERYPASIYAADAVARANGRLLALLDSAAPARRLPENLSKATPAYDPLAMRRVIQDYTVAIHKAPRSARAPALVTVARLWERMRRPDAARRIYDELSRSPGIIPADSTQMRLAQLPAPSGFTAAILRNDGMLLPFAAFADNEWVLPWSSDQSNASIADAATAWFEEYGLPATRWYHTAGAGALTVLVTTETKQVDVLCQTGWGLASNYEGKRAEPGDAIDVLAVVLDAEHRVEGVTVVPDSGAESLRLRRLILPAFERGEKAALVTDQTFGKQLPVETERNKAVLDLHATRLLGADKQVFHMFEATREYPSDTADCNYVSVMSGWILPSGRSLSLQSRPVRFSDCDRKEVGYSKPLGTFIIGDRTFIFSADRGYESESFGITELRKGRLKGILSVDGGGC